VRLQPSPSDRWPRRTAAALGGVAAVALLLTGCSASPEDPDAAGSGAGTAAATGTAAPVAVPAGLEDYYGQNLDWQACEQDAGDFECATVEAPLDYDAPEGERVELAVVREANPREGDPHLLLNPGGPGVSGVDLVVDSLDYVVSGTVQDHYTVVGFDPRGVSRSSPVECLTDAEQDEAREVGFDPDTEEGLEQARTASREYAEACDEHTGEILGHLGTDDVARDMDLLRGVLGDERLNYLGYSYGTALGASYAGQFPGNVGRMVLDGAMDPSLTEFEATVDQAVAFEDTIRSWVEFCLAGADCPLSGTVDNGVEQLQRLLAQVEESPMTASDGRQVPATTFASGMITPLYANETWPALTGAIRDAMNGNPDTILSLADLTAQRDENGHYTSNVNDAFTAVKCLDLAQASDTATLREQSAQLEEAAPTLGPFLAYGGLNCADWPEEAVDEPAPASAPGAAPIVVIGTQGDPATPYQWAPALAGQLESGVLVTWNGEGHTAYGRAGACIGDAVDGYLVDGTVPEDGLTCG
jgi:pimeloyl-ACP methyl ester carboxylesterase